MFRPLRRMGRDPFGMRGPDRFHPLQDSLGKTVAARVDPCDCKAGQGRERCDQRAPDMPRPPDPDLPGRMQDRLHHPTLDHPRRGEAALTPEIGQDAFDGKRHIRRIAHGWADHHIRWQVRRSVIKFRQQHHRPAAALPDGRPQGHPVQRPLSALRQHRPRARGRLKLQCAAPDRAGLPLSPNQHRSANFARGRPVDARDHHAHNRAMGRNRSLQGVAVKHRPPPAAPPPEPAPVWRVRPARDRSIHPRRPPPHPTAPDRPRCPA